MRIGVDVDGVLADFNTPFIEYVVAVIGVDRFPARPFEPTTWDYPEQYGYSSDDVSRVWETIKGDTKFWRTLPKYETTLRDIEALRFQRDVCDDDVYFITARPGRLAKWQTERWLACHGFDSPTVLISGDKALCASALALDVYIDDKPENVVSVLTDCLRTSVYLMDRPWNGPEKFAALASPDGRTADHWLWSAKRVTSVLQMVARHVPLDVVGRAL